MNKILTRLAFSCVGLAGARSFAVEFSVTDLNISLGTGSWANAISSDGKIAGYYNDAQGNQRAYYYANGHATDLGTLGGRTSFSAGVNSSGTVVGTSDALPFGSTGFLYSGGTMQKLNGRGFFSQAYGINDAGQVVGFAYLDFDDLEAYIYQNGVMTGLGSLGGERSLAYGINNLGQVTGNSETGHGSSHAFLYANNVMQDLGSLGGNRAGGVALNDLGQVVGWSDLPGGSHAFLWQNGQMADLGTLGGSYSTATGINNSGWIMGHSSLVGDQKYVDFLMIGGQMHEIGSLIDPADASKWNNLSIGGMNDAGEICGSAQDASGMWHSVLLKPENPVPEPATMLLALGSLGLVLRRRRN